MGLLVSLLRSAQSGSNEIILDAADLVGAGGSPNLTILATSNAMYRVAIAAYDATAYEATYVLIPASRLQGWNTLDVDILCGNSGTGTGVVRWRVAYTWVTPTTTLAVNETTGANIDWTATDRDVVAEVQLIAGLAVVAGKDLRLQIQRRAGDAEDTLANDAGVVRVVLGKAS